MRLSSRSVRHIGARLGAGASVTAFVRVRVKCRRQGVCSRVRRGSVLAARRDAASTRRAGAGPALAHQRAGYVATRLERVIAGNEKEPRTSLTRRRVAPARCARVGMRDSGESARAGSMPGLAHGTGSGP